MSRRGMHRVVALAFSITLSLPAQANAGRASGVLVGVDASSLPAVEAHGARFRASPDSAATDALVLLQARGVNAVRLRLWHTPADGSCDLAATTAMARRAKLLDMKVLLDLHLSDTWADPSHQSPPAAWAGITDRALEDSVRRYTRQVVSTMRAAGALPDLVQIGNEVGNGMLWPHGAVSPDDPDDKRWRQFARLFRAGARGVRDGAGDDGEPEIVLHLEHGGDARRTRAFLDRLRYQGTVPDIVGLSYYPWWHGSIEALLVTLRDLAEHGESACIVETAYPWTLGSADDGHNIVGLQSQLLTGFPATPEGQKAFVARMSSLVSPGGYGLRGLFYWEPADVAAPGRPSSWENLALFDFGGVVLPAIDRLSDRWRFPPRR